MANFLPPFTQQLPVGRAQALQGLYGAITQLAQINSPAQRASFYYAKKDLTKAFFEQPADGFRPPQWAKDMVKKSTDESGELVFVRTCMRAELMSGMTNFFFDAVMSEEHSTRRTITEHPVQWGASITDHSYQMPATLTLEIGMSDSMSSFSRNADGDFVYKRNSEGEKCVNAYQAFVALQKTGVPLVVQTRLSTYKNMVIESITTNDSFKTYNALRCSISFKEIFIGVTGTVAKSLYPAATTKEWKTHMKGATDSNYLVNRSLIKGTYEGTVQGTLFQSASTFAPNF